VELRSDIALLKIKKIGSLNGQRSVLTLTEDLDRKVTPSTASVIEFGSQVIE
jgi:hypothetical protein